MTTTLTVLLAGCGPLAGGKARPGEGKTLLTVDFKPGQTLRYKFVSSRRITVGWDVSGRAAQAAKRATDKSSESMEMIVSYTPVEINPYGLTTIKAKCESMKVSRSKGPQRDAAQSFAGKTFTFTVGPTGKIEDYSQLDELIKEVGKKAFRPDTSHGRIKEPDMINDFVASQWFLWDAVSSIKEPAKGVAVGQSWHSKLSVPTPMVMRKARDVTYTLAAIRPSEQGRLAVIRSSYAPAKSVPRGWPIPYSGRFQPAGAFGFYRHYQVVDLKGEGQELFNIDAGRIQQYSQHYQLQLKASLLLPLPGASPRITIDQTLTMTLMEG
jgi:Family of unknown function (DUF6263)